jgi:hypothetical protein
MCFQMVLFDRSPFRFYYVQEAFLNGSVAIFILSERYALYMNLLEQVLLKYSCFQNKVINMCWLISNEYGRIWKGEHKQYVAHFFPSRRLTDATVHEIKSCQKKPG